MKKHEGISVSVTHRFSASAERVFVPCVSSDAVSDARPACAGLSASLPLFTISLEDTRGRSCLGTTITRRPFSSVFSTGAGRVGCFGADGSGGTCCARENDEITTETQRSQRGVAVYGQ